MKVFTKLELLRTIYPSSKYPYGNTDGYRPNTYLPTYFRTRYTTLFPPHVILRERKDLIVIRDRSEIFFLFSTERARGMKRSLPQLCVKYLLFMLCHFLAFSCGSFYVLSSCRTVAGVLLEGAVKVSAHSRWLFLLDLLFHTSIICA